MMQSIEIYYGKVKLCTVKDNNPIAALAKFLNFKYGIAKKNIKDTVYKDWVAKVIA